MKEADLHTGEMACIDRCTWKYLTLHAEVNQSILKYKNSNKQ